MQIKRNTKNTPLCVSSNKIFLKHVPQDIYWDAQLFIKPIDAEAFQNKKATREGNNDQNKKILNGIV